MIYSDCTIPGQWLVAKITPIHKNDRRGLTQGPSDPEADDIPMCHHASLHPNSLTNSQRCRNRKIAAETKRAR